MWVAISQWVRQPRYGIAYTRLDEGTTSETPRPAPRRTLRSSKFIITIVILMVIMPCLYFILSPLSISALCGKQLMNSHDGRTHLRLVIPATNANVELCKTMYSAAALGYPAPSIANWGMELNKGEAHMAKISGVLKYLEDLGPESDEDLVLMIDALDVWLQLRPETLIRRYYDILKRLDERVRSQTGTSSQHSHSVVFSAQKHCWPNDFSSLACTAAPNSTLPADVYGNATDTLYTKHPERKKYKDYRPRYVNSGSALGSAAALRAVFSRAQEKAAADPSNTHDQGFFADVFGEQEYMRNLAHTGPSVDAATRVKSEDDGKENAAFEPILGRNYEFGMALDYEMSLFMPTAWSVMEADWLRISDPKRLRKIYKQHGLSQSQYWKTLLPSDITSTGPPSAILRNSTTSDDAAGGDAVKHDLPSSWKKASLFTDLRTGVIPVAIHHNEGHHGYKNRIQSTWNQTWYQPHLRTLLDAQARKPAAPVATLDLYGDGKIHEWWSDSNVRVGATTKPAGAGELLGSEKLCRGYDEELFRDVNGPWLPPDSRPD